MKRIWLQPYGSWQRSEWTDTASWRTLKARTQAFGFSFAGSFHANKWTGRKKGRLLSLCIKTQRSETNGSYLFFLHYIRALLICHSMYSPKGGKTAKMQRDKSQVEHSDHGGHRKKKKNVGWKKKWGNYFQNKQLPFASQVKNNKSKKWPVAEHLNTHINHKNSYTAPWQCIATVQNFSQGERRQKNTLLLLTPASHFGLQRF